jgi:acyl carrier protein
MDDVVMETLISDLRAMSDQMELDLTGAVITAESSLADLGVDSLNLIDFLASLEKKYRVRIPDDMLAVIETPGDILAALTEVPGGPR